MTVTTDPATRAAIAHRAATEGAAVAAEYGDDLDVTTKGGKTDVVTAADHAAQERVVECLRAAVPDDPVVGEEDDPATRDAVPASGPAWVVDPIDGTHNYVRGLSPWGTAVAAIRDGRAEAAAVRLPPIEATYVAGPDRTARDGRPVTTSDRTDPEACVVAPTLWWERDQRDEYAAAVRAAVERFDDVRRMGSAQACLAAVADGGLDGAFSNRRGAPWDTVAGVHLIRRAGGRVTDLAGDPWRHDSTGLVASNGAVHEEVLAVARAGRDAGR